MKNYIQAGRLAGTKIVYKRNNLYYKVSHQEEVVVNRAIVRKVECIGVVHNKNFISGFLRGLFGKFLGSTAWLSAVQSAKNNTFYNLKIIYRDNSASIILVDYILYLHFMEKF